MKFFWDRKDLAWLAAGFALEVGLWTYFFIAMGIDSSIAIDVIVVLVFIGGLHLLFKLAIRRYERAQLVLAAIVLALLGVVASETVAAVSSMILGGGELSYTFERDAIGYLALFSVHFAPAALCAYGVRRPAPATPAPPQS